MTLRKAIEEAQKRAGNYAQGWQVRAEMEEPAQKKWAEVGAPNEILSLSLEQIDRYVRRIGGSIDVEI